MAIAVRPILAVLAATLTGCALAYSFDTLSGGTADGGAASDAAPEGAAETAPPGRFCATVDADFCDDFDDNDPIGARWNLQGLASNPVLGRDAAVTREPIENSPLLSAPSMLRLRAGGLRAKAALFDLVPPPRSGGAARGVDVVTAFRAATVIVPVPDGGGRLEGAVMLGVITEDATLVSGVGLVVRGPNLFLYQTIESDSSVDTAKFQSVSDVFGANGTVWGRLHFAIGPRDELVARGMTSCQSLADGMTVAAQLGPLRDQCMLLEGRFASNDWLSHAALSFGPVLFGDGQADVLADNVVLNVF